MNCTKSDPDLAYHRLLYLIDSWPLCTLVPYLFLYICFQNSDSDTLYNKYNPLTRFTKTSI